MNNKLRIAWFSPLNCGAAGPSTSAYVSDQLLPLLSREFEIELFHDSFSTYPGFPTSHYLSAFRLDRQKPYDLFFYQVEDKASADFCRMHLGLVPGVVLFHDFFMRTRGPVSLIESPWMKTVSDFNGHTTEELSTIEPLAWREAACAPFALFSDPRSLDEFRRKVSLRLDSGCVPEESSYYLPLPAACSAPSCSSRKCFTVCFSGSVQVEHRVHKLALAMSRLKNPAQLLWLVDAGEETVARELLAEYGIENARLFSGKSPQKWAEVSAQADVAVHTLFSAYGQCGPYLQISLMAGIPCLITDFGSADYWPESLLFKVEPGENEATEIAAVLEKLSSSDLTAFRDASRSYASSEFAAARVARELSDVCRFAASRLKGVRTRWSELAQKGKREVVRRSLQEKALPEGSAEIGSLRHLLLGPVYKEFGWLERRVKEGVGHV